MAEGKEEVPISGLDQPGLGVLQVTYETNSIIPMQQYPPNEEVLKSAQTCLAVFADFGTELRSGEL